jgi:methylamine dehydrogenase accessory protein MauD
MPIGWAIAILTLWLAVAIMIVIMLGVLRQVTSVLERVSPAHPHHGALPGEGPALGEPVPHFASVDTAGMPVDDQGLRGRPALLLFVHKGCAPCEDLVREMRRSDLSRLADQLVIVTDAPGARDLGIPAGLRTVAEAASDLTAGHISGPLTITGWPFAVALDPAGLVRATGVPNTVARLEDLAGVLT